jgi:hypothetical protein
MRLDGSRRRLRPTAQRGSHGTSSIDGRGSEEFARNSPVGSSRPPRRLQDARRLGWLPGVSAFGTNFYLAYGFVGWRAATERPASGRWTTTQAQTAGQNRAQQTEAAA